MSKTQTEASSVSYTFRGYDYMSDGTGGFIIMKNGAVLTGPLSSQEAVRSWIAEAKQKEMRR
jgi:hypothetical protein